MTYNNNNYYEPEDDNYSIELQERIYDTVKNDPEYDPSDIFKMGEAIQQSCNDEDLQAFIRDCVEKKEWALLGRKLYYISYEYQESHAEFMLTK